MTLFDLSGRVALVSGGNGGIGLGMAQGLAQAGARVLAVGRDEAKNAAAVAMLGQDHAAYAADVTRENDCAAAVAKAERLWGRLDILVNNAGTNIRKRPERTEADDWHAVLDANLTSMHFMSRAAFALLRRQGGKIINIGSMMSVFGPRSRRPTPRAKAAWSNTPRRLRPLGPRTASRRTRSCRAGSTRP